MKIESILHKEFDAHWKDLAAREAAQEADESLWLLDFLPVEAIFAQLGSPAEGAAAN
jgi:hypothetical protein